MLPIRCILHPCDFSESSDAAFDVACALARDYRALLLVLYVHCPDPLIGEFYALPPEPEGLQASLLERVSKVRPSDRSVVVEHRVEVGDPATEILRVAQEAACDLLVMGTHGRTGIGRWLMGSVAEQVVRKASCSVLTVKPQVKLVTPAQEKTQTKKTTPNNSSEDSHAFVALETGP